MKNIVRIYERFSELKQSRQKASSLNKQVVLNKRATTLQKNHKSFPVKYQLVGVFCLLLLDMLSSRRGLVAAQVCRQERRQETLEETAPKYGVLDIWNEPWMEFRHCGVQLLQLNHYIKCKCKGSLNLLVSPLHNSPTLCKCCHSIALRTNMTLSSNMTDYSAVLRDQANLRWWLACRYRSS